MIPPKFTAKQIDDMFPDGCYSLETARVIEEAVRNQFLCHCKDRLTSECPDEWEPGCDLGNNEAHAVAVSDLT